ncbi:hypothetical protein TWF696_009649 [Orbilia brochopaga]|uniref:Uncharacterized protein n=1 Tax=Orbilia brochopaga TaxID=3140254 RepID=A0AAV9UEX0_9PEZI
MKVSAVISSIALFALASAAPSSQVAANSGVYHPMTWTGAITEGGPEVELNGTAQEITAQILELNPNWKPATEKNSLVAREWRDRGACGLVAGNNAERGATEENINYLRGIGEAGCGAKAHSCSRIACNWGSGIELCNDNDHEVSIQCRYLAEGAAELYNLCAQRNFKGQRFETGNFNIVVRASNC